jgi:hypothetical protein
MAVIFRWWLCSSRRSGWRIVLLRGRREAAELEPTLTQNQSAPTIVDSVANVAPKSYVFLLFVTVRYIEQIAFKHIKTRTIVHFLWDFTILAINHAYTESVKSAIGSFSEGATPSRYRTYWIWG